MRESNAPERVCSPLPEPLGQLLDCARALRVGGAYYALPASPLHGDQPALMPPRDMPSAQRPRERS